MFGDEAFEIHAHETSQQTSESHERWKCWQDSLLKFPLRELPMYWTIKIGKIPELFVHLVRASIDGTAEEIFWFVINESDNRCASEFGLERISVHNSPVGILEVYCGAYQTKFADSIKNPEEDEVGLFVNHWFAESENTKWTNLYNIFERFNPAAGVGQKQDYQQRKTPQKVNYYKPQKNSTTTPTPLVVSAPILPLVTPISAAPPPVVEQVAVPVVINNAKLTTPIVSETSQSLIYEMDTPPPISAAITSNTTLPSEEPMEDLFHLTTTFGPIPPTQNVHQQQQSAPNVLEQTLDLQPKEHVLAAPPLNTDNTLLSINQAPSITIPQEPIVLNTTTTTNNKEAAVSFTITKESPSTRVATGPKLLPCKSLSCIRLLSEEEDLSQLADYGDCTCPEYSEEQNEILPLTTAVVNDNPKSAIQVINEIAAQQVQLSQNNQESPLKQITSSEKNDVDVGEQNRTVSPFVDNTNFTVSPQTQSPPPPSVDIQQQQKDKGTTCVIYNSSL